MNLVQAVQSPDPTKPKLAAIIPNNNQIAVAKNINTAIENVLDQNAFNAFVDQTKESAESKHIAVLQLDCYSQSQLAQDSVNGVLTKITHKDWFQGVYILFETAVSRMFFETFATTLHGKGAVKDTSLPGVNVMVNASQRMLAVQTIFRHDPALIQHMATARNIRDQALGEISLALTEWKNLGVPLVDGYPEKIDNDLKSTLKALEDWQKKSKCNPVLTPDPVIPAGTPLEKIQKALLSLTTTANNYFSVFKTFLMCKSYLAGKSLNDEAEREKTHGLLEKQRQINNSDEVQKYLDAQVLIDRIGGKNILSSATLQKNTFSTEAERQEAKKEALDWLGLWILLDKQSLLHQTGKADLENDEMNIYESFKENGHTLIKVGTDGRFVITKSPSKTKSESALLLKIKDKFTLLLTSAQNWLKNIMDISSKGSLTICGQIFQTPDFSAEKDLYVNIVDSFQRVMECIDARMQEVQKEEKAEEEAKKKGITVSPRQVPSTLGEVFVKAVGKDLIKPISSVFEDHKNSSALKSKWKEQESKKQAIANEKAEKARLAAEKASLEAEAIIQKQEAILRAAELEGQRAKDARQRELQAVIERAREAEKNGVLVPPGISRLSFIGTDSSNGDAYFKTSAKEVEASLRKTARSITLDLPEDMDGESLEVIKKKINLFAEQQVSSRGAMTTKVRPLTKVAKIGFFTAVKYRQDTRTSRQSFLEKVDNYFYLGGKKAYVIQGKTQEGHEMVVLSEAQSSLLARIAKVFSYLTLIIPLIMLVAKAILRYRNSFQIITLLEERKQSI